MKQKKNAALMLSLLCAFGLLAGCGNQPTPTPVYVSSAAEAPTGFQAGVWEASDGTIYQFDSDGKSGRTMSGEFGVPFAYESDAESYTFHMGSVDNVNKATVTFDGQGERAEIVWEDGRTDTLVFVSHSTDEPSQTNQP